MKKLYVIFCGILLWSGIAQAADPSIEFVSGLTDKIIENVLTGKQSKEEKLVEFQKEFTTALDLKSIGQFVLGIYWRKATSEERDAFLTAFIDFATKTWADRFDSYTGQKIIFTGTRNAENNQLYVDSQIQNNPPVEVIWRLRKKKDGYRIIDIIIEGVSMAMSYRNEYSAFLQSHDGNVSALTQELKRKSDLFQFSDNKN